MSCCSQAELRASASLALSRTYFYVTTDFIGGGYKRGCGPGDLGAYLKLVSTAVAGHDVTTHKPMDRLDTRSLYLKAVLIKADGVAAKDLDGLSDPYAVLEIMPKSGK
jgi:hypothetical protein